MSDISKKVSRVIILAGPSGSGKTTIGRALAARLGWPYFEGDDFHPPANIEKMRRGEALNDADRRPWLEAMREKIEQILMAEGQAVMSCSALKQSYRQMLRVDPSHVKIVMLDVSREVLVKRLGARKGHFFDPSLLDSQLQTLQDATDTDLRVDADQPVETVVGKITSMLDG